MITSSYVFFLWEYEKWTSTYMDYEFFFIKDLTDLKDFLLVWDPWNPKNPWKCECKIMEHKNAIAIRDTLDTEDKLSRQIAGPGRKRQI